MTTLPPPPPGPPVLMPGLPRVGARDADRAQRQRELIAELSATLVVVLTWFSVAGVLGALIWVKVTPLPEFTRIATTGTMDEEQLSHQFAINGWFLVIAVIGGFASGLILLLARRGSPVVMVVLVACGGALATWLMVVCGLAWGPPDPNDVLAGAKLGEKIPIQLKPDAHAIYYAWSFATMLGAAVALWILDSGDQRRARNDASAALSSPGAG